MTALGMGHLTIVREGGKCTVRGRNVQRLSEDNVKIQRALTRQVLQLNKGLESWTRDQFLDPDWLRIGTDIVDQGTFNAAFVLNGVTVPGPAAGAGLPLSWWLAVALSPWRVGGARWPEWRTSEF